MTLVKGQISQEYKETPISKPGKGIRVISEMRTSHILWFVARRHRVGLLTFALVSYIACDHISGLSTFGQIVYGTIFG